MSDGIDISIGAKDLTRPAFASVNASIKGLSGSVRGVTAVAQGMVNTFIKFGQVATGVESVTQTVAGLSRTLLGGNAALEMTKVSFTTLLGSAKAANQEIQDLTKFAANTPFNLPGLEAMTQRLLAASYTTKEIIPYLTSMGDTIAALGGSQAGLDSLVYVFGQMRTEAKLNAGDIRQVANLGIPALELLANHYKKTTSEIQDMITDGLIPGKEAAAAFAEEMEKRYGGMMQAQSRTLSGMISNIQDWASATMRTLTLPLFEPAKKALAAFLDYVNSPAGVQAVNNLATHIQRGVNIMTAEFVKLQPHIVPFIRNLIAVGEGVKNRVTIQIKALVPVMESLWQKIQPIAATFLRIYKAVDPLGKAFSLLQATVYSGLNGAFNQLRYLLTPIPGLIGRVVTQLKGAFGGKLAAPIDDLILVFNSLVSSFRGTVIPAFQKMTVFLSANAMPIFDRFAAFTAGTVIPTLASLAAFTMTTLVPAFVRIADVAGLVFGPSLVLIGKIIRSELLPNLTTLAANFDQKYLPTVRRLAAMMGQNLASSIALADTRFRAFLPTLEVWFKRLEPAVAALLRFKAAISPVGLALTTFKGLLTGGVSGALEAFQAKVGLIGGYLKQGLNLALTEARKYGPQFISWAADLVISLAQQAVKWGEVFIQWVAPYATRLITELLKLGAKVINWAVGYAPVIANQLFTWGTALVEWVAPAVPRLIAALVQLGIRVINWAVAQLPAFLAATSEWGTTFVSWIAPTVPVMVGALGQIAVALVKFAAGLGPLLVTTLLESGRAIGVELGRPVSEILVVFQALVSNIKSTVIPAFTQMTGYLSANLFPVLDRLAIFTAGTIIPTLASLAAFAMTTLVPAFVQTASILGSVFGPSLTLIGGLVRNELLPTLSDLWATFEQKYLPTVKALAANFGQDLAGGLGLVITGFSNALPVLEGFYNKVAPIVKVALELYQAFSPLAIAFDVFKGFLTGGVEGALGAFEGHMGKIGDIFQQFGPQLLNALTTGIPQVLNWIGQQAPVIFEMFGTWADSFGKLADKVMPPLMDALGKVIGGLFDWVTTNAPMLLEKLGEWAGKFGDWAMSIMPLVMDKLGTFINTMLQWLGDKGPEILAKLGEWAGKFVEWAAGLIAKVFPEISKFAGKLWDWIGEQAPGLADKLSEWAGAFINWIVTQAIPGLIQMLPKIWVALFKFIGEIELNIVRELVKWVGAFLGWIPDVVRQIPGKLWDIITAIGGWVGGAAGNLLKVAGDIGGKILEGIVTAIHDAPGKIWDAVTGVLGSGAVDIIKGVVRTVANFFVDVVNTPINLLNSIVDTLHGIDIFGAKPFEWIPKIPTLGYLSFAQGTGPGGAPGGLSMVGDNKFGPELVRSGFGNFLATQPTLVNLSRGDDVIPLVGRRRGDQGWGSGDANSSVTQPPINIYLTVHGQPDQAQLLQMKKIATEAVKEAQSELHGKAQNSRTINRRTRG